MIVCIDIGNTRIRCALGLGLGTNNNYRQAAVDTCTINDAASFAAFLQDNFGDEMQGITGGIYSSVVPHKNNDIVQAIAMLNKHVTIHPVNVAQMAVDFSLYKSVIGEDRAVCSAMAAKKYNTPVIVIDFGTATTINVVNQDNIYLGGAILAGVQTGIDALAKGTARLPQLDMSGSGLADIKLIGQDTYECLVSGAVMGAAFAATGYVQHIKAQFAARAAVPPTIVITGGNAEKVMPHCEFDFTYEPTLLIEGMFWLYESTQ
ncbi:MAG: type III pantothenate kinase [Defluviitaleaceae bacterium]|nr:type III pantothenate kinase [Defluviitaleaceae bacterium]